MEVITEFDWVAAIVEDYVKGRMTLDQLMDIAERTLDP